MRAILILCTLVLSGLAVPVSAAPPDPECAEFNILEPYVPEEYLQINLRRDCSLEIVALEGIICVGGWGGVIEQDIDRHTVRAYYCTGRDLPPIALAAQAPDANELCAPVAFDKPIPGGSVSLSSSCHVTVSLRPYECFWGGYWQENTVGPVTLRQYKCGPDPR